MFLASGASYSRVAGDFGVSEASIVEIVKDCATSIIDEFKFYLTPPDSEDAWLVILLRLLLMLKIEFGFIF